MNLAALKLLSTERLKDAKALLQKKRYLSAYYMAGYGVECALKACILKQMVRTGWVFVSPEAGKAKKSLQDVFTHDFSKLIEVAGLDEALEQRIEDSKRDRTSFWISWGRCLEWKVDVRYETTFPLQTVSPANPVKSDAQRATELYEAITSKPDGVLAWLKKHW